MSNLATYSVNATSLAARIAEVPNADFTGGVNRAQCNEGVGICTDVRNVKLSDWTELDQAEAVRDPQNSQHIGGDGLGAGDATVMPITIINGADINDTAILITADTQATPTNIYHIASGAINVGTDTIEIGDLAWGVVPVT
jgi:hypothetical protein